jgi:hypothetical protein
MVLMHLDSNQAKPMPLQFDVPRVFGGEARFETFSGSRKIEPPDALQAFPHCRDAHCQQIFKIRVLGLNQSYSLGEADAIRIPAARAQSSSAGNAAHELGLVDGIAEHPMVAESGRQIHPADHSLRSHFARLRRAPSTERFSHWRADC